MDQREEILRLVIMKGPVLPSHISKDLKRDSLFTAAMLSEMVDSKKLKLTKLKIGGSPLYYAPGQENKLQFYSKHLHEKEQRAYEKLRTEQILADDQQEPVIRAALREIKDFAVPLEVTINNTTQLVWKWYLLPASEVEPLIKQKIVVLPPSRPATQPEPKAAPPEQSHPLEEDELKSEQKRLQETIERLQQKIEEQKTQPQVPSPTPLPQAKSHVQPEPPVVHKKEPQEEPDVPVEKITLTEEKPKPPIEPREQPKKEKKVPKPKKEQQQTLQEEPEEVEEEIEPILGDAFYDKIKAHFDKNKIEILKQKVIRKNSEIEFELLVPSSVGELSFFCKARNKKKCNDGDLSSAFLEGQRKKMPVLFLTTGELTKKAATILTTDLKSITVQTIEA